MSVKENPNFLRCPEVLRRVSVSKATIDRLERAGRFPKRRKIGARAVGWVESEVMEWLSNKSQECKDDAEVDHV